MKNKERKKERKKERTRAVASLARTGNTCKCFGTFFRIVS